MEERGAGKNPAGSRSRVAHGSGRAIRMPRHAEGSFMEIGHVDGHVTHYVIGRAAAADSAVEHGASGRVQAYGEAPSPM